MYPTSFNSSNRTRLRLSVFDGPTPTSQIPPSNLTPFSVSVLEPRNTVIVKDEPYLNYEYSSHSMLPYGSVRVKPEYADIQLPIKVLDVTSISLNEMEKLSRGHNTILENPLALARRNRLNRLRNSVISPPHITDYEEKFEFSRPSNAVATVLQEQDQEEEHDNKQQVFHEIFAHEIESDHQQLLRPVKIEGINNYVKRKRGRPRKIRPFLPLTDKVVNGQMQKRKRGRPRKSENGPIIQKEEPDKSYELVKKPDNHYFSEEILMTRLRNKRL